MVTNRTSFQRSASRRCPELDASWPVSSPQLRIMIVEDHEMIAEGLRAVLDMTDDLHVVAVANTLGEAERVVVSAAPDVVVCDFHLPDGEAPDLIDRFRTLRTPARALVISASSDARSMVKALESGAFGFLVKDRPVTELMAAIRAVHRGQQVVSPSMLPKLVAHLGEFGTAARLTARETEVLQLLADGLGTHDLADRLHLSIHTVRNHIQRIMLHLGAHTRLEAVAIAIRDGMIDAPSHDDGSHVSGARRISQ